MQWNIWYICFISPSICARYIRWPTQIGGNDRSILSPAHSSSYFITSPLSRWDLHREGKNDIFISDSKNRILLWYHFFWIGENKGEVIRATLWRCKLKSVVARITTRLKHCHAKFCCCQLKKNCWKKKKKLLKKRRQFNLLQHAPSTCNNNFCWPSYKEYRMSPLDWWLLLENRLK